MRGIKKTKKGFSLIEVVISVAILIILMIPIASVTISTVKRNAESEEKQRASFVGQKMLEALRNEDELTITTDAAGDEKCELKDGSKLNVVRDTSDPLKPIKELVSISTDPDFLKNDGKDNFYVKVKLTRNTGTTYTAPNYTTIDESKYRQKIYFNSYATDNFMGFNNGATGVVGADKYNINTFSTRNILIMEIDSSMKIKFLKRDYDSTVIGTDSYLSFPSKDPATGTFTEEKILLKLNKEFTKADFNLYVISNYTEDITIDVFKEETVAQKPTGSVNVSTIIVNPNNGKETVVMKKPVKVKINQSTYQATTLGDIYSINVDVSKQVSKSLFTGDDTTNILVR